MKPVSILLKPALLCLVLTSFFIQSFSQTTIIPYGSSWKYLDNGTDQGTAWQGTGFSDAAWSSGIAEFGYGDGDENTCVRYGENYGACPVNPACNPTPAGCNNKFITTYFRKTITIADPTIYSNFTLNVKRDDGIVVYINGTERYNNNMPAGRLFSTPASASASDDGDTPQSAILSSAIFSAGTNVIAVEIHQNVATSGDITFDMELTGNDAFSSTLTRGPYLQMANQTEITIHWRTSAAQNSKVELGTVLGTYPIPVTDGTSTTEHIIRVTGLAADTKYYYRIGNSTNMGNTDAAKFFTTMPPSNTTRKIKIAAFGDCGRNLGNNSLNVNGGSYQDQSLTQYQTFLANNGIDAPDAWLLLGDNAYDAGTDAEYTSNFFGIYGSTILKNNKLFPSPGNHDYANSGTRQDDHAVPYYAIFDLPSAGQCGGVASTKEEYYSYDIGNIHFLALDAYGEEANKRIYDAGSAQAAWVVNDLAANTKKWTVAYWHHPPYTMGSHNSDSEGELISMRSNFISILENAGVDLIICGHSHDYERSYLIKGHYGLEATFNAGTHAVSTSDAKYISNATCPYVYNSSPINHGTVYVVAGSTGASGNTQGGYPHNALPFAVNDGGFFYFEVDNNRLDAKFIRRDGTLYDNFTIMKDVNKTTNYTIANGSSKALTASWPQSGSYTWAPSVGTTKTVNVTPPNNAITNYTVTDAFGCVTDQFAVTTTSTLPVSLLTYNVKLADKKVNVNWSTGTEINNKYFTIERSVNGNDFNAIGTVNGAGNSTTIQSYSFVDAVPLLGNSYYRLLQTNFDSHKEYMGVRRIENISIKNFDVKALSGFTNKLVLQINSSVDGVYHLNIFDLSGKKLKDEVLKIDAGISTKEIDCKPGVYIWEVRNNNGDAIKQKVIVQ